MPGRYEHVDHTADLLVRATGDTLGEAFAAAALGMFAHISDPARVERRSKVRMELDAHSVENLLFDWLEELRFKSEMDLVLFSGFTADVQKRSDGRWHVSGEGEGESYDEARHGHIHEVKAVTRHGLKVQTDPPLVEVIVDI